MNSLKALVAAASAHSRSPSTCHPSSQLVRRRHVLEQRELDVEAVKELEEAEKAKKRQVEESPRQVGQVEEAEGRKQVARVGNHNEKLES